MSTPKEIAEKILTLDNEIAPLTKMELAEQLAQKVLGSFNGIETSTNGTALAKENIADFFDKIKNKSVVSQNSKEIAEMIINQNNFEQEDFIWLVHNSEVLACAYLELEKQISEAPIYDIHVLESEITKLKKSREWLRKACEFYASSDQWNCTKEQLTTYNTIDKDDLGIGDFQFACDVDDRVGGKKAREALEADDSLMKEV